MANTSAFNADIHAFPIERNSEMSQKKEVTDSEDEKINHDDAQGDEPEIGCADIQGFEQRKEEYTQVTLDPAAGAYNIMRLKGKGSARKHIIERSEEKMEQFLLEARARAARNAAEVEEVDGNDSAETGSTDLITRCVALLAKVSDALQSIGLPARSQRQSSLKNSIKHVDYRGYTTVIRKASSSKAVHFGPGGDDSLLVDIEEISDAKPPKHLKDLYFNTPGDYSVVMSVMSAIARERDLERDPAEKAHASKLGRRQEGSVSVIADVKKANENHAKQEHPPKWQEDAIEERRFHPVFGTITEDELRALLRSDRIASAWSRMKTVEADVKKANENHAKQEQPPKWQEGALEERRIHPVFGTVTEAEMRALLRSDRIASAWSRMAKVEDDVMVTGPITVAPKTGGNVSFKFNSTSGAVGASTAVSLEASASTSMMRMCDDDDPGTPSPALDDMFDLEEVDSDEEP